MDVTTLFNPGRIPSKRILQHPECYALIHFSLNTFTGKEWGYGDEDPDLFNPPEFDADQIVRTCKEAGLEGVILVCKHHDGFCLWPTKTTRHSVASSCWKNGKGDVVREFADACRKAGLKIGFYVSPWDRNHPAYGTQAYLEVYREQLREICTGYGPAFEVWFDGANGGDGFYGGAREKRKIDQTVYYGWQNTWKIIRDLQPEAVIFSDVGPDVRWAGNEEGHVTPECFGSITFRSAVPDKSPAPGFCDYSEAGTGNLNGNSYVPPECDFPLRPGWFYRKRDDVQLKSLRHLIRCYLNSVGHGGFLNIGLSPDRRGKLHDGDVQRLREFGQGLRSLFENSLFSAEKESGSGEKVLLSLPRDSRCSLLDLREDLSCGERICGWSVTLLKDGKPVRKLSGTAAGRRRISDFPLTEADGAEVTFSTMDGKPVRWSLKLYHAPEGLLLPEEPVRKETDRPDYARAGHAYTEQDCILFDFREKLSACGFILTPDPRIPEGTPAKWALEILPPEGGSWKVHASGEFGNLKANPVPQIVEFPAVCAIGFRLRITEYLVPGPEPAFLEIGLLLKP